MRTIILIHSCNPRLSAHKRVILVWKWKTVDVATWGCWHSCQFIFNRQHCLPWESIPGQQLTASICITSQNLRCTNQATLKPFTIINAQLCTVFIFSLTISHHLCHIIKSSLYSYMEMSWTGAGVWFLCPLSCFVVQVESRDTLNSIALKFDTTPNELVQLNKLFSRAVVPGQVWTAVHASTDIFSCITSSLSHSNLTSTASHLGVDLLIAVFDSS